MEGDIECLMIYFQGSVSVQREKEVGRGEFIFFWEREVESRLYLFIRRMKEEPEKQIIDVARGNGTNNRYFSKEMQCLGQTISYQNHVHVSKGAQNEEDELQIKNYMVTQEGDKITKVISISLRDTVIKISDSYAPSFHLETFVKEEHIPDQDEQEEKPKKRKYLLEKRGRGRSGTTGSKKSKNFKIKDTKNIVKNIYRLFQKWVAKHPPEMLLPEILETLLRNNGNNYNNDLILRLFSQQQIKGAFLTFSEEAGREAIENSKIKDKEVHLQALGKYRQIGLEGDERIKIEEIERERIEDEQEQEQEEEQQEQEQQQQQEEEDEEEQQEEEQDEQEESQS